FEEFATIIGLVAKNGITGAMAGTQFRSMLTRMVKPTAEARKIMEELNISFFESGEIMDATVKPVFQLEKEMQTLWSTLTLGQRQEALIGTLQSLGIATEDLAGKTYNATDAQKILFQEMQKVD